jgi:hypothetical protein
MNGLLGLFTCDVQIIGVPAFVYHSGCEEYPVLVILMPSSESKFCDSDKSFSHIFPSSVKDKQSWALIKLIRTGFN